MTLSETGKAKVLETISTMKDEDITDESVERLVDLEKANEVAAQAFNQTEQVLSHIWTADDQDYALITINPEDRSDDLDEFLREVFVLASKRSIEVKVILGDVHSTVIYRTT